MRHENSSKTLLALFCQCFILSMFTFGGGSTIIALLQKQFVEKLKWIDETEMLEMITLAQSSPGATSVNTAMLIGYSIFGVPGAFVSAIATALPPLIIIVVITFFYDLIIESDLAANALRGVRACAAALVFSVSLKLLINLLKKKDYFLIAIWICALLAGVVFKVNALIIVLIGLVVGILHVIVVTGTGKKVQQ